MTGRENTKPTERKVSDSLQEYGRGVAGGLMFSLPLLYTMEVWWVGFIAHPFRLLVYVLATFVLLLGYNLYAGLRRDASMWEVVIDSVEEMGLGIIISAIALYLLGRITPDMQADEIAGTIVVEAMTIAIGVSVGTAQLGGGGEDDEGFAGDSPEESEQSDATKEDETQGKAQGEQGAGDKPIHFGGQVVIAMCGAMLFAANLAPTEEIVIIAIENSWIKLLGLAFVSLLLAWLILHCSGFKGAQEFVHSGGVKAVLLNTIMTYAVALFCAGLILWFFGRFDGVTLYTALAQTVVLGVAATLGASAGRLLLQ